MGFPNLAGRIVDQGIGQERGVFGQVGAVGVQAGERVEGGRGLAGDAEGVEDIDGAKPQPRRRRDAGVLALGIDAQDRAVRGQQIGDDGAHALARAGGRDGQEMGLASVAEELATLAVLTADDQARAAAERVFDLRRAGEVRRAVDAAADLKLAKLGPPIAYGAEYAEEAGGDAQARLKAMADVCDGRDGDQDQAADQGADQIASADVDQQGDEPQDSALIASDSNTRRPRCRQTSTSAAPPSPWSLSASSRNAPSRAARSSAVRSTRPAFWTRPPSSIRWRVRSRRCMTQARLSLRAA